MGKKVLIATQHQEDLRVLLDFCQSNNWEAKSASTFNELMLALGSDKKPNLIIMDQNLPDEGALRIIPMLRSMGKVSLTPILVTTPRNAPIEDLEKILEVGANDYLFSPMSSKLIKSRINACLGNKENPDFEHQYVLKNLFRLVLHDVSNLFINFEIFMNAVERDLEPATRQKRITRARMTLREIREMLRNAKTLDAIRSQKLVPQLQDVNLPNCIDEVREIYTDRLSEKGLKLSGNWTSQTSMVRSEATSLKHQVIGNLLTNAIKFSHPGGTIDINIEEDDSTIKLKVADHGIGMSSDNISNLFKEGKTRSRKGTRGEKGSGYGLPLVYQFVRAYNGDIKVESLQESESDTSGTTFIVTLQKSAA